MPSTRTSAKSLRLPAHCLIAKYGRGCRIPVVSRRPMRASRCVVFTLRRCAPPSGWRLDSGDRVVTWRHLDLRAVLRDGKGNLGDWTSSGKALEKRLCLRPLPTADSARRCNTPTARAVFSMLQRPAESETRSGHFRGRLLQQRPQVATPLAPCLRRSRIPFRRLHPNEGMRGKQSGLRLPSAWPDGRAVFPPGRS